MPKKPRKPPNAQRPVVRRQRLRAGDQLITFTTKVESAIVYWGQLTAAVCFEPDYTNADPPWKVWEGLEHAVIEDFRLYHEAPREKVGRNEHVRGNAGQPGWQQVCHYNPDDVIRVFNTDERVMDERILVTVPQLHFQRRRGEPRDRTLTGVARQVVQEELAVARRNTLERLKDWYRNGFQWYWARGEYRGEKHSLCGLMAEDEEFAIQQVAEMLADDLEAQGYLVRGRPRWRQRKHKQYALRARIAAALGFPDVDAYRQWLSVSRTRRPAAATT